MVLYSALLRIVNVSRRWLLADGVLGGLIYGIRKKIYELHENIFKTVCEHVAQLTFIQNILHNNCWTYLPPPPPLEL